MKIQNVFIILQAETDFGVKLQLTTSYALQQNDDRLIYKFKFVCAKLSEGNIGRGLVWCKLTKKTRSLLYIQL